MLDEFFATERYKEYTPRQVAAIVREWQLWYYHDATSTSEPTLREFHIVNQLIWIYWDLDVGIYNDLNVDTKKKVRTSYYRISRSNGDFTQKSKQAYHELLKGKPFR